MLNATADRTPLSRFARTSTVFVLGAVTMLVAGGALSARSRVIATDVALVEGPHRQVRLAEKPPATADAPRRAVIVEERAAPSANAAQNAPAVVTGTLYDQLGGFLPGVQLQLAEPRTGAEFRGTSDRNGQFEFRDLPSGAYQLTARLPGFAPVTTQVILAAGQAVSRSITMPIGSLQETLTVSCTAGAGGAVPPSESSRSGRGGPAPAGGRGAVPFSGGIGGQISVPRQIARVNPTCPSTILLTADTEVVLVGRIGIDGYIADLRPLDTPGDRVVNRVVQRDVEVFDNLGRRRVLPARQFQTLVPAQPEFVQAALNAVSQWTYTPTLLNGVPVEANITVTVAYSK